MGLQLALGKLVLVGVGIWGNNVPVGWAIRHHQLRLVDRHRPRRHADLGDPAALPAAVADVDQPVRRSHDAVRGGLRGDLPAAPHRPTVAGGLLAVPLSEHDGPVAEVPQPADLGRVRGLDLRDGFGRVLVRRPRPRPGDLRDRAISGSAEGLRRPGAGLARSARHWHRYEVAYLLLAGLSTPLVLSVHTRRELRLRGRRCCPAGTRRSSRPTSSRAPSTPASRWC